MVQNRTSKKRKRKTRFTCLSRCVGENNWKLGSLVAKLCDDSHLSDNEMVLMVVRFQGKCENMLQLHLKYRRERGGWKKGGREGHCIILI